MSKIKRFCIAFGLVLVFAVLVILIKPNLLFEPDAAAAVPPTERTAANSSVTEDRAEYTNNTEPPPAETYAEPLTDALIEIPAAEPPESLTEPQIESETEPQTEPQTEPETERQTEPETEQQTEPATELSIDRTPPSITVTVNNINISEDVTADIQEEQVINISASHSSGISEIQYTAGDEAAKIVQNSTASFWFTGAGFVDVKISAAAANGTVSEIHVYKLNIIAKPPPPPTEPPPPPDLTLFDNITGGVSVIGCSVALGAKTAMINLIPDCYVDALVSRPVRAGAGIVKDLQNSGELREYVVIALGTNGAYNYADLLTEIIDALNPGHRLIFVTPFDGRSNTNSGILRQTADWMRKLPEQYDYITIADWESHISRQTELLARDNVHMGGPSSMNLYAELVAEAIGIASQKPAK